MNRDIIWPPGAANYFKKFLEVEFSILIGRLAECRFNLENFICDTMFRFLGNKDINLDMDGKQWLEKAVETLSPPYLFFPLFLN